MKSYLTHLECGLCSKQYDAGKPVNVCECGGSLLCRYDLKAVREQVKRGSWAERPSSLWKYFEVLPVLNPENVVTLGEGDTPLVEPKRLAKHMGMRRLYIKDEGVNPTGSFKARGMTVAISKAAELGIHRVGLPTAGNAGSAAAAYSAKAGLEAHIFMPKNTPGAMIKEMALAGARTYFVDGPINVAAQEMKKWMADLPMFDLSTLREPYRAEGKKIMAYEIAEQMGWTLPDVMIFPTGGGTGVIGMWKAFQEMKQLGWVDGKLPRIYVVQPQGCAPLVEAFAKGAETCELWKEPKTIAAGLAVPRPYADRLILKAVRESGGACLAVSDKDIREGISEIYSRSGVFACPEGAACLPALVALLGNEIVKRTESVVLFNTGSGLKYLDLL
jgi:threonine synthase